jgi:DNA-binding GntR family transcriptional regulator
VAPPITRVTRPKISEEIADYLRDQIISGRRRPGERIVLDDVAVELGVSRMPVRDAVLALSHEGLAEVRPRRGVVVAAMSHRDVLDAYRVLAFIGGSLAERAAVKMSAQSIRDLDDLHAQMDTQCGRTPEELEQLNWRFHRIINRTAASRKLLWLMRSMMRNVPQHFYQLIPDWQTRSHPEHAALVGALRTQDAALARQLAEQHVLTGGSTLVQHLERSGFWRAGENG